MVFHRGHWLTLCLRGSATPRLQPATPTRRTRRLFPTLGQALLGRFGNIRVATFFHNLIALLRHLPFLTPFAQWFLYRFSRCAFWLHTAIMSRRMKKAIPITLLLCLLAVAAFATFRTRWMQCTSCGVQEYERSALGIRITAASERDYDEWGTYAQWRQLHGTTCTHRFSDCTQEKPAKKFLVQ